MKKMILALSMLAMAGCGKVPAGFVGVKVHLLGGSKGVDNDVLGVGRYWIGVNEELYTFPTFQQNYVWSASAHEGRSVDESLTFQTKEGMTVNTDLGISYSLKEDKVGEIFQKYRKGVDELTDIVLRNAVRDALNEEGSRLSVEEMYGSGKMALLASTKKRVKAQFDPMGIIIDDIYLVGSMRLPPNVVAALNSKIEATQRAQQRENELREAEAEAKKSVAKAEGEAKARLASAEAEAKANQLKQKTLTRELIQYEAVTRWDGKLPSMMGSGAVPFININSPKEK